MECECLFLIMLKTAYKAKAYLKYLDACSKIQVENFKNVKLVPLDGFKSIQGNWLNFFRLTWNTSVAENWKDDAARSTKK